MFVNDTQRRRLGDKSALDTNNKGRLDLDKSKTKSRMPTWIRFSPSNVKKIMVALVIIYIVFKVYQLLIYSSQPEVIPPDPRTEAMTWTYKSNPQGIDQEGLDELLDEIQRGKYIGDVLKKPVHKNGGATQRWPELQRMRNPYVSKGSLTFKKQEFFLNNKPFRIYSGAMHYFRVLPEYWEDRMKKMIAGGLNTLETYVAWNLHEDSPGNFTFKGILDLRKYISLAHLLGLKVILRPGPYICSEWDFGGLPAWLLKDPNMKVRSNYHGYTEAVDRYFGKLIPLIADLQYSKGGPIIAVQIENEFGSYSTEVEHLKYLKKLLIKHGIVEMLFTSDGQSGDVTGLHNAPFYDEALPTVNFKRFERGERLLQLIESISEDFPLVVMEFWSGWFDHWQENHAESSTQLMASTLQHILSTGASVNFYMYHGGTNFGFMAGANWFNVSNYKPDVTSYDYIAPLSEAGDITPKYEVSRELIKKVSGDIDLEDPPHDSLKGNYGQVDITHYIPLEDLLTPIKYQTMKHPVPMEMLTHNNGVGQNYGFILYRAHPRAGKKLKFTQPANDRAQIIMNGIQVGLRDWFDKKWEVALPKEKQSEENILDILVENNGRVNFVLKGFNRLNEERKGIAGKVLLDDSPITEWKVYPMEFKPQYIKRIMESKKWKKFANWEGITAMYSGTLTINGTPRDTFINMKGWNKGNVFINGFNIGRYWRDGPQKTLYVPAPILKVGKNEVVIFELHKGYHSVIFQATHILG